MPLFYAIWNTRWRQVVAHWCNLSVFSFFFKKRYGFTLLCTTLLVGFTTVGCLDTTTNNNADNTNAPQATATPSVLSSLQWCSKPAMVFRDQANPTAAATKTTLGPANGTPTAVNDWNTVKSNLGFTIFLPKTLPTGTCLLNVSGSLRDPIFGSNFTITYVLPDQNSISLSQAPVRAQNTSFQCSVSGSSAANGATAKAGTPVATPTPAGDPIQLCNGVREKTNIVFSARGTTATLEQFFQALQPDVDWVPAK